jgi:lysozyme family protein
MSEDFIIANGSVCWFIHFNLLFILGGHMGRKRPPTLEDRKQFYLDLLNSKEFAYKNNSWLRAASKRATQILEGPAYGMYKLIQDQTGVPWIFSAITHHRESGGDFTKNLCNGQPLRMKTTWVPKGRGPYNSFEESAYDALVTLKHLNKVKHWDFPTLCYYLEQYNGWGYYYKNKVSPYLVSGLKAYKRGKYVADGRYSCWTVDEQMGTITLAKELCYQRGITINNFTDFMEI